MFSLEELIRRTHDGLISEIEKDIFRIS